MITLIVPTYNEATNLVALVEKIDKVLKEGPYEIVVVDDGSPDGTGRLAEKLASSYPLRVIHRAGKRGLGLAVRDGLKIAQGDILGFMDADLSHPPESLRDMRRSIEKRGADIAVGSRFAPGGRISEEWSKSRWLMSYVARLLARPLTPVQDCTSGFFLFRREVLRGVHLTPIGYKIGLELLVKGNYGEVVEVPIRFEERWSGSSKMSFRVQVSYLVHLGRLYAHRAAATLRKLRKA